MKYQKIRSEIDFKYNSKLKAILINFKEYQFGKLIYVTIINVKYI
jgi:hypothetical protein